MADKIKSIAASGKTVPQWPYTVAASTGAGVASITAANVGNAIATIGASLLRRRAGAITVIADNIQIATNAATNLLAGNDTQSFEAGDDVGVLASDAASFGRPWLVAHKSITGAILAAFADSTAIGVICANGAWYSTDSGASWTRSVTDFSVGGTVALLSAEVPYAVIAGNWFAYQDATHAWKSTDHGATWSRVAVTNGPTVVASSTGSIAKNGSTYYGLNDSTHVASSTDGTAWTLLSAALPQAVASICHDGTNIICGRLSGANDVYSSPAGASWATASATGAVTNIIKRGLVASPGVVIALGASGGNVSRSTDHGATWASVAIPVPNINNDADFCCLFTGNVFYIGGGSADNISTSATGLPGTWYNNAQVAGSRGVINAILTSGKVLTASGTKYALSADANMTPFNGVDFHINALEVPQ